MSKRSARAASFYERNRQARAWFREAQARGLSAIIKKPAAILMSGLSVRLKVANPGRNIISGIRAPRGMIIKFVGDRMRVAIVRSHPWE